MIKIKRENCPPLLNKPNNEFVEGDCNNADVENSLLEMQHDKCCYCERNIGQLERQEREVEHYVPKSAFKNGGQNVQWHQANKWENLLFACRPCNSRKSTKNPFNKTTGEREIIDPSQASIDPEDHIDFVLSRKTYICFKERNGSLLGRSTIEKLKLNERKKLLRDFRNRRREIEQEFISLYTAVEIDETREINKIRIALKRLTSADITFASFNRQFIKQRLKMFNEDDLTELGAWHGRPFEEIEIDVLSGYETIELS